MYEIKDKLWFAVTAPWRQHEGCSAFNFNDHRDVIAEYQCMFEVFESTSCSHKAVIQAFAEEDEIEVEDASILPILKSRVFQVKPEKSRCGICEVRTICKSRAC